MARGNITNKEASFTRVPEMTYSIEEMEQLLGNLQLKDDSNWLERYHSQVTVEKVCHGHVIKYKITVNNMPRNALSDVGMLTGCMVKRFFDTLPIKPKLISWDRYIANTGCRWILCVQLQIGKRVFRDRVVVTENLRHKYILEQVLHRLFWLVLGTQPQVNIVLQ